jgi:hypothetical protein
MYTKECYQGKFIPKNPQKYMGDPSNIIYRSSYEVKFMIWCDRRESVLQWGSEELVVPYVSPLDNQIHRYFVDFIMKVKTREGVKTYMIEVKPYRFTQEPVIPKRKSKNFLTEVKQWGVNQAKWNAAKKYAEERGWEFMLITERDLGVLK